MVMIVIINKLIRKFCLVLINVFLCSTNFFRIKRVLLRFSGVSIGVNSKIVGPVKIGTVANLIIGDDCWIGSGITIYGNGNVNIGNKCDLAPDIAFVTGSHEIGSQDRRAGKGTSFDINIEDSCWIGARVTIMGGVNIYKSSIVGASSLVNKNVIENTVFAGVPAKKIKAL
jgi:maltose O-acetyltransferase